MNATRPSTTTILRWLRRSGRWYLPLNGMTGSIHSHFTPIRSSSANVSFECAILRDEMWSASSRTDTPRATARSIAEKNPRVVSSHATMKNSTCTQFFAVSISAAMASIDAW